MDSPSNIVNTEENVFSSIDVRAALRRGIALLRDANISSYTLAAELLLLHVVGRDRTWLYAHPEEVLSNDVAQRYFELISRRASGVPVQHLTGKQEFWGLEFEITPDVLIPRPETEHVIEGALDRLALREIQAGRKQTISGEGLLAADVGTGSGCIAIALAKELPGAKFVATDISGPALEIARCNAKRHGVADHIQFVECHLLDGAQRGVRCFDVIVSNPPYVGHNEKDTLEREVRDHEPELALYGGEEGYEIYAELIAQAAQYLKAGGLLVLELGHNTLAAVRPLLELPDWDSVGVTNDLAGIPRVIAAVKQP
jgi:release factor glutamine methyltransferase